MQVFGSFFSSLIYAFEFVIRKKKFLSFLPSIGLALIFYVLFSGGESIADNLNFMEDWWLVGWIFAKSKTVISFIAFMLFEFFVLVLLSPVNAYMAEQAREDLTGENVDFNWAVFMRSLRRMVVIIIVGVIVQLSLMLVLWIFSLLFGDLFYEIASMLSLAFFVGFSFFDFSLELDEVKSSKSWKYARKNWIACVLIGLAFNLAVYYPQMHGFFWIYLIAISILPNILALASSKMYYEKTRDLSIYKNKLEE